MQAEEAKVKELVKEKGFNASALTGGTSGSGAIATIEAAAPTVAAPAAAVPERAPNREDDTVEV